jgi:hypothetical protein
MLIWWQRQNPRTVYALINIEPFESFGGFQRTIKMLNRQTRSIRLNFGDDTYYKGK